MNLGMPFRLVYLLVLMVVSFIPFSNAHCTSLAGPSYKCVEARNEIERRICKNESLSRLDRQLDNAYSIHLSILSAGPRRNFIKSQRNWLQMRNRNCDRLTDEATDKCIEKIYQRRICEIHQLIQPTRTIDNEGTWAKHFVRNACDTPLGAFRAYYFDERRPGDVVHTAIVDHPAAHYSGDSFYQIAPKNFGAYWVGHFYFSSDITWFFNVFQKHAETKIIIDGQTLWQGDSTRNISFSFTAGVHKIEIQYINSSNTVDYSVKLMPPVRVMEPDALAAKIDVKKKSEIWYCGTYKSNAFDGSIKVRLQRTPHPIILFLNSYEPVTWDFVNANIGKLEYVILSCSCSGSSIKNLPANIKVFHIHKFPYAFSFIPEPGSVSAPTSSDPNSFKAVVYRIQDILHRKPTGFSGKYGMTYARIPTIVLDEKKYREIGMTVKPKAPSNKDQKRTRMDMVFE